MARAFVGRVVIAVGFAILGSCGGDVTTPDPDPECDEDIDCAVDERCRAGFCVASCGAGVVIETSCSNQSDEDCDGLTDCEDPDCSNGTVCGPGGAVCSGTQCACPGGDVETTCSGGFDEDCDLDVDCADSDCAADPVCVAAGSDDDQDGLDDAWEASMGNLSLLDPTKLDTNGNGTPDGNEDPDGDGLTNRVEYEARTLTSSPPGTPPHPFRKDLLVELDAMTGRMPSDDHLSTVVSAYAAANVSNLTGGPGVAVHVYVDEVGLGAQLFDGTFEQRQNYFSNHGPTSFGNHIAQSEMIHVVVAQARTDMPGRGGEAIDGAGGDPDSSGVMLYWDTLQDVTPLCGFPTAVPPLPDIVFDEALVSTFVHELGHTLRVGHDTDVGGSTNHWNIMSVPGGAEVCSEMQMRFHGWQNTDPSLGNTESIVSPRFSDTAAGLIDLGQKLSVDTGQLDTVEM